MEIIVHPLHHEDIFNVLLNILRIDNISFVMLAVSNKDLHTIMSSYGIKNNIRRYLICANIASLGYLDVLKYARDCGYMWDRFTCANAAYRGHLELLKYAHENGCPWDSLTCETAAEHGHLDILKYAYE